MEDTDHDNSNPTLGAHTDELGAHHDDITDLQDSVLNQPIALPASRYDNTTTVETYDDNATIKNKEEEKIDTITEVTEEKVQLDNVATTNESKSAEIDEGNMIQPGTVTGYPLRRIGRTNYHHLLLHNGQEIILHLDGDVEPLPPTNLFDFHHQYGYAAHIMVQQMSAKKGLKLFGERAAAAIVKECKQLHDKQVFIPISFDKLTSAQRIRALRAITLIAEKRSGDIKGRTVADGRSQRDYTDPGDAASPTVSIEALLLSCVIDALEERDVATCDISGAFLQADIDDVVHVKFEGPMVDLMIRTDPLYKRFVKVFPSGKKVLMVQLKKAMYGCIKAARLFYENLKKTLLNMGFVLNPYDQCVANREINGSQCTILWHVDDVKISHKDPEVVTKIIKQLEDVYGVMNVTRGKKHVYVGMTLNYGDDKDVTVDMTGYIKEAIEEFTDDCSKMATTPAALHLFKVDSNAEQLPESKAELFHRIVAKLLFVSNRGQPDIQVPIAFLTTRTHAHDIDDWKKLQRMLQYLNSTMDKILTLSAQGTSIVKWWADAAYGVHTNLRSHTGGALSLGRGVIKSKSSKQKLNTKSSTEAELVGAVDLSPYILWTRYFLKSQGYDIKHNILYQDNMSAMRLEKHGRASSGIRTRHINIRYFFLTDRIRSGELDVIYCPTDEMIGDFFTKPLQGKKFIYFRDLIMGHTPITFDHQERVGNRNMTSKSSAVILQGNDKDGTLIPGKPKVCEQELGRHTCNHKVPLVKHQPNK